MPHKFRVGQRVQFAEEFALWMLAVAMWAFAIGLHVARILGGHHG